jgi:hypothetical protein
MMEQIPVNPVQGQTVCRTHPITVIITVTGTAKRRSSALCCHFDSEAILSHAVTSSNFFRDPPVDLL